jgi:hypothetical protein
MVVDLSRDRTVNRNTGSRPAAKVPVGSSGDSDDASRIVAYSDAQCPSSTPGSRVISAGHGETIVSAEKRGR